MEKYRSRTFMLMLYNEDETHQKALERIKTSYDYAGILHDRDKWTEADEKEDPKHKAGTLKKPHNHVILRFSNMRWNTAIAKELGIEPNYMQEIKNFNNALLYLLHYNDTDKAQYDISEVFGNLKTKLNEAINSVSKSEGEKVVELIQFIRDFEGRLTVTIFAKYCAENGYWSEFRRSGAIFCKIIDEHNEKYTERQR